MQQAKCKEKKRALETLEDAEIRHAFKRERKKQKKYNSYYTAVKELLAAVAEVCSLRVHLVMRCFLNIEFFG